MKKFITPLGQAFERRGLSISEASEISGIGYDVIWKHCKGMRSVSAEMAVRYESTLQIPRWEIRPDLWQADDVEAHLLSLCLLVLTFGSDLQKQALISLSSRLSENSTSTTEGEES